MLEEMMKRRNSLRRGDQFIFNGPYGPYLNVEIGRKYKVLNTGECTKYHNIILCNLCNKKYLTIEDLPAVTCLSLDVLDIEVIKRFDIVLNPEDFLI